MIYVYLNIKFQYFHFLSYTRVDFLKKWKHKLIKKRSI